jgi:hypothetical protein
MARANVQTLNDIGSPADALDFRPARQCAHCDGSCRALLNPLTVRELLRGRSVPVFRGTVASLQHNARRGCELARLLESMPYFSKSNIVFYLQKMPAAGLGGSDLRLVSVLEGDPPGIAQHQCSQVEVVTGAGRKDSQGAVIPADSVADDPASTFVPGRPVDSDPVSPRTLVIISQWLASCTSGREGHEDCPKWEHSESKLPTRVVDVTSTVPRLYTPRACKIGQYAALSY